MRDAATPAGRRVAATAIAIWLVVAGGRAYAAAPAGNPASNRAATAGAGAGRLEQARRTLALAIAQHAAAKTLDTERRLAEAYLAADVADQALDHFSAALRLDPHDVRSLEGTARIWRDWGYLESALPPAYRAVFWGPDSASARNTLGTVLLRAGALDAAAAQFTRARELEPASAVPINNLCYLELQRGRAEAAVPLCRAAVDLHPASQIMRNNLALALVRRGAFAEARDVSGDSLEPALAAYNEGVVWLAERDPRRAVEAFGRSRRADPSFRPAIRTLRQLSTPGKDAAR